MGFLRIDCGVADWKVGGPEIVVKAIPRLLGPSIDECGFLKRR